MISSKAYDPNQFGDQFLKKYIQIFPYKVYNTNPELFDFNRILFTEEILENDDKFYSLGILSSLYTFFTVSTAETKEYPSNLPGLMMTLEFYRS